MHGAIAQDNANPAYMNPRLAPEARAIDLVHRMTLEEKASQLVNQARAIPRLKVQAYDWWSEALHGVAVDGTTEFPEPIGLAATFDVSAIHTMANISRSRFLGAEPEHIPRSAVGTRTRDLWRRPISHGPHGGRLCDRHARR
jgi:hypothetical protein